MPICGRVMEVSHVAREEYVQFDVRTDPYSEEIPFTEYFRRALPDATVEVKHGNNIVIKIGKDDDAAAAERLLELFKTSVTILDDADESHALGIHSYGNGRTELGDLVYGAKTYTGKQGDRRCAQELAERAVKWIGDHPTYRDASVVAAAPSSTGVNDLPEMIAKRIISTYQMELCQINSTSIVQQKNPQGGKNKDEDVLQGKFSVPNDLTSHDVILIDDLYETGQTMVEGARALRQAGAKSVLTLAMSKTRRDVSGLFAYKENWEDST